MCEIEHVFGMVASHWQLVNADVIKLEKLTFKRRKENFNSGENTHRLELLELLLLQLKIVSVIKCIAL